MTNGQPMPNITSVSRVNTYEIYALLYGLSAELAALPYEQYPNIGYELSRLCEIFAPPTEASADWQAFHKGLLSWQQKDASSVLNTLKDRFSSQIEQYRNGETKVLGFLVGQLVKEGCDPIKAREAWLKELGEEAKQ